MQQYPTNADGRNQAAGELASKPAFQQPKLTFVKPELTRQGDFSEITAGFFGTFDVGSFD